MCLGIKIAMVILNGLWCYWLITGAIRANVKDGGKFREEHIIKKIDMIFTEEDDLLNANKWRGILAVTLSLILEVCLIISFFK